MARYRLKITKCNLPHHQFTHLLGVTPTEFRRSLALENQTPWVDRIALFVWS